jgi:hypothetical protein
MGWRFGMTTKNKGKKERRKLGAETQTYSEDKPANREIGVPRARLLPVARHLQNRE